MSSQIKPVKVWGEGGPNPPKVRIILEELGIPYEVMPITFADVKDPEYLKINPNGRLPSIHDPNNNLTLWESGAIVEYLIEQYDKTYMLSFPPGTPESWHAKQWLFYQTTGQGPYYGQAGWFKKLHHEKVPSAIERYLKEVNRVSGVLDKYLADKKREGNDIGGGNGPWLVGNKISYADLVFVPWQKVISMVMEKDEYSEDNFPSLKEWLDKMNSRDSVKVGFGSGHPPK